MVFAIPLLPVGGMAIVVDTMELFLYPYHTELRSICRLENIYSQVFSL